MSRTADGFVTGMHDLAVNVDGIVDVPFFNPAGQHHSGKPAAPGEFQQHECERGPHRAGRHRAQPAVRG